MRNVWLFLDRMNLLMWGIGLFAAHVFMYLLLGTDSWLATSLLATSVWAAVLLALKIAAGRFVREGEGTPR